jgi:fumarate reductase flavoprotein subunit
MHKRFLAASLAALFVLIGGGAIFAAPQPGPGQAFRPGVYSGKAMGLGGLVEVRVTVDASRILDLAITADKETEAIGGAAIKTLREQILTSGSAEVDAVSGATRTCNAVKEALQAALDQARGTAKAGGLKDGKYVTKAMGHEGYINVATTFRGGKIEGCKVISHEETMGIGNYAVARIPPRIVEAQSLEVDAVAGATISSGAIKAAVAEAVKLAGGDLASFQKPSSAAPAASQRIEKKVDVVIAGAGTAGLIAGARLADEGKSVLVFEKAAIPGGSMPMTYGGALSSGTKVGAAWGQGREQKDIYWNESLLLNVLKNYLRPQFDRYNKAMPYKTASLDASGPMVDWLREIGVGFAPMGKYEGGLQLGAEPYFAPGCYQGGAGYAAMALADHIAARGQSIVYETPVVSLRADKSGRVIGLRAEGKDGRIWEVTADAVILATGGFASNREMVAKYYPAYKDQNFNAVKVNTGDGIRMAQEVGAEVECMDRHLGAFPAVYGSNYEVAFITITVPGIMVNGDGKVIRDSSHVGLGDAKLDPANKGRFYYLFDEEGAEALKKSQAYGFSYASVFDRGEAVRYASVAEAAKALGLPELAATVDANNQAALAKKPRASYLETREGLWAIRIDPNFYLTTGGIVIDTKARVLDRKGSPIPGLYAAGDVAGSIEEKDGLQYGYGCDSAMTFGYIAANEIIGSANNN